MMQSRRLFIILKSLTNNKLSLTKFQQVDAGTSKLEMALNLGLAETRGNSFCHIMKKS